MCAYQQPPLAHRRTSSFLGAAPNLLAHAPPPLPAARSRSFYRTNSAGNFIASALAETAKEDSEGEDSSGVYGSMSKSSESTATGNRLFRVGSHLSSALLANSTTPTRKIIIESLYKDEPKVEPAKPPSPPPPSPSPPPVERPPTPPPPQRIYEVVRENRPPPPPLPQYIIEKRLIAAKKDPDEEALEHAIMISKQEEDYGVNMYDALTDSDEPIVEEFIALGFTREEAILIIFEEKMGIKKSEHASIITPAMPTLHRSVDSGASVSVPAGFIITEEVEREIEKLMIKGFTREQAVEVLVEKERKRREAEAAPVPDLAALGLMDEVMSVADLRRESNARVLPRIATGFSGGSNEPSPNMRSFSSPSSQSFYPSPPPTDDDSRLAYYMARGMTMEQALALLHEERRSSSGRSFSFADEVPILICVK